MREPLATLEFAHRNLDAAHPPPDELCHHRRFAESGAWHIAEWNSGAVRLGDGAVTGFADDRVARVHQIGVVELGAMREQNQMVTRFGAAIARHDEIHVRDA